MAVRVVVRDPSCCNNTKGGGYRLLALGDLGRPTQRGLGALWHVVERDG